MGWLDRFLGKSSRPRTPIIATVPLPPAAEGQTAFADQVLRKEWAESVLRAEGVQINPHLPMIESEAEIVLRSASEVADRLRALSIVAARASGLPLEDTQRAISDHDIGPHLTQDEQAFLAALDPEMRDRIRFSWRNEAAWVLFWSLGHAAGPLGPPRTPCSVSAMNKVVVHTPDLDRHGLRSANDILNEADLIYRYHWAVRQSGIDGKDPPAGLHPGVVIERHHALNWLIGYNENADWDDVTTDT